MKKVYFILAALFIGTSMMAQATPQEKRDLHNDLAKERSKRHEVAKDVLLGEPAKARADNRAAIAYHKDVHRDVRHIGQSHRRYHPHHRVYHHRVYHHHVYHRVYHHRHPRRTVVVIHH
jgi:hypothetical protein